MSNDQDFSPLSPTISPSISSLSHLFPSEFRSSSPAEQASPKMAHLLSLLQDAVNVKASIGDFQKNVIETDPESARQFGTLVWILAGGEAGERIRAIDREHARRRE